MDKVPLRKKFITCFSKAGLNSTVFIVNTGLNSTVFEIGKSRVAVRLNGIFRRVRPYIYYIILTIT